MRSASFASPDLSDAVTRTEHLVPGDPPVPVRVHRANDAVGLLPAVVTIHGGGYVIGSYDMDSPLLDRWCPGLGVVGVSVEYRLAPETPYPGPLEDCYAALRWTYDNATTSASTRTASASTGSAPGEGSPPRWPCWPAIVARSRSPSRCSTAPCSTTASRRPPSGPTGSTCGDRLQRIRLALLPRCSLRLRRGAGLRRGGPGDRPGRPSSHVRRRGRHRRLPGRGHRLRPAPEPGRGALRAPRHRRAAARVPARARRGRRAARHAQHGRLVGPPAGPAASPG